MSKESKVAILKDIAAVVLAVLPFSAVYLLHFFGPGERPTGFIQYDMPYYLANAREIFERGNGFAYPNPYDPTENAPLLYFHWFLWLLGALLRHGSFDPGHLFVAVGAASALAFSGLTLLLVRHVLATKKHSRELFLLAMWGGGLLCLAAFADNLSSGEPAFANLLRFDPANGLWFLSWGRNVIYPTESFYHLLAVASWLAALSKRYFLASMFAALLAATHPWSGLQVLLTLCGFFGLKLFTARTRAVLPLVCCALVLAAFLTYYLLWLPSFPEHLAVHSTWDIDWSLPTSSALLAWLPIGVVAVYRLLRDRALLGEKELFLFSAFAVSASLSLHDRLIAPTQPLHFTRGYVWMPLLLLALPCLQEWRERLSMRSSPLVSAIIFVMGCGLFSFDNAAFIADFGKQQLGENKYSLTQEQHQLLDWIAEEELDGVLLSGDMDFNYLSATYTGVRPYLGHVFLTPNWQERFAQVAAFFERKSSTEASWFTEIDYVVLSDVQERTGILPENDWRLLKRTDTISLYARLTEE